MRAPWSRPKVRQDKADDGRERSHPQLQLHRMTVVESPGVVSPPPSARNYRLRLVGAHLLMVLSAAGAFLGQQVLTSPIIQAIDSGTWLWAPAVVLSTGLTVAGMVVWIAMLWLMPRGGKFTFGLVLIALLFILGLLGAAFLSLPTGLNPSQEYVGSDAFEIGLLFLVPPLCILLLHAAGRVERHRSSPNKS